MARPLKLLYEFNTAANLEVEYKPSQWARVTANWFRSFVGGRRVDGTPYNGPVYYEGTNLEYKVTEKVQSRIVSVEELNDQRLTDRYAVKKVKLLPGVVRRSEKHLQDSLRQSDHN